MSALTEAFRMPTPVKISGRASTVTNAFVTSIIPQIVPTDEEIAEALRILQLDAANLSCAYCGDPYTEWDHLRPIVMKKRPTGYVTEIRNLVPACGKCNQSKGNKPWKDWITSSAARSPMTRQVENLQGRIGRLAAYEKWGSLKPVPLESLVDAYLWARHWDNHGKLLGMMEKSQQTADALREAIESRYREVT